MKEHSDSKTNTLKMTSSRCSSFQLTIFSWFLPEKSSSRQLAVQWVQIVSLFSSTSFCIHTKIQSLLSTGKKQLAFRFYLTYRYIYDVFSVNNPEFQNYLGQIYPAELEIKDTTYSTTSASYLNLLLSIGRDGILQTSIYDKRDDFNFHNTNFPFLSRKLIFNLRRPMAFLSLRLYDTPGLAPRMNV